MCSLLAVGGDSTQRSVGALPGLRGHLHNGQLTGTVIECPLHGTKFDVTDGGLCSWVTHPAPYKLLMDASFPGFMKRGVGSYPTRVEGDDVYVEV